MHSGNALAARICTRDLSLGGFRKCRWSASASYRLHQREAGAKGHWTVLQATAVYENKPLVLNGGIHRYSDRWMRVNLCRLIGLLDSLLELGWLHACGLDLVDVEQIDIAGVADRIDL